MARVMFICDPPPTIVGDQAVKASHYRTWQFLDPLVSANSTVLLCCKPITDNKDVLEGANDTASVMYSFVPFGDRGWVKRLQAAHDKFQPDCIIAIDFEYCLYATKIDTCSPVWMDIYGDMLTIMQAASFRSRTDRGILTTIELFKHILRSGDRFSVCGEPQKHALVGELAMEGRLNRHTFGYDFVDVVMPGVPPALPSPPKTSKIRSMLENRGLGNEASVVLWAGGYNTWTDVETLFRGLERAMQENACIQYVSVGASTYDASDSTYERFLTLIEQSRFRDRYHMLGWRPWQEMPSFYQIADLGINIDAMHYETIYGTRTRLVEMIGADVPVVTSLGSELSFLLQERNAASTFEIGDWQELGKQTARLAASSFLRDEIRDNARRLANDSLSFDITTRAVQHWIARSRPAPDHQLAGSSGGSHRVEYRARSTARSLLWRFAHRR